MSTETPTKWKRRSTEASVMVDVDVDLEEFSPEQLLQELINREYLTEELALAIVAGRKDTAATAGIKARLSSNRADLEHAEDEIRRGRRNEALIHIERYLGREWTGQLAWT